MGIEDFKVNSKEYEVALILVRNENFCDRISKIWGAGPIFREAARDLIKDLAPKDSKWGRSSDEQVVSTGMESYAVLMAIRDLLENGPHCINHKVPSMISNYTEGVGPKPVDAEPREKLIAQALINNHVFMGKIRVLLSTKSSTNTIQKLVWDIMDRDSTITSTLSIVVWVYTLLRFRGDWDYLNLPKSGNTEVQLSNPCIKENQTMQPNKPKFFETKAFLNGREIYQLSPAEVFQAIAAKEKEIASLEQIENQPAILIAEITEAKGQLADLVVHLDNIEEN